VTRSSKSRSKRPHSISEGEKVEISQWLHDMWCNAYKCWEANVGNKSYQKRRMETIEALAKRWGVKLQ
jgi:hypothetical protein